MKPTIDWPPFSKEDFRSTINKCNNLSAPGPDHVSWKHLKVVIEDNKYLLYIINIANTCINIEHWQSHFKKSSLIIISKLNKMAYNSLEMFCLIILLNILEKLIEKVIGERLQY